MGAGLKTETGGERGHYTKQCAGKRALWHEPYFIGIPDQIHIHYRYIVKVR